MFQYNISVVLNIRFLYFPLSILALNNRNKLKILLFKKNLTPNLKLQYFCNNF